MTYASIADFRADLVRPKKGHLDDPVWAKKMLHHVPDLPYVKDRALYLVQKAQGEVVLDLGCTGEISKAIRKVAKGYYGVDKEPGNWEQIDLDREPEILLSCWLDSRAEMTMIVLSELLEHLANPGRLLDILQGMLPGLPLWISVPQAGAYELVDGTHEMVNPDHVCWYSYTTLKALLARCGYTIDAARWYGGRPTKPEGLIVKAV